jgi:hypothetical protein
MHRFFLIEKFISMLFFKISLHFSLGKEVRAVLQCQELLQAQLPAGELPPGLHQVFLRSPGLQQFLLRWKVNLLGAGLSNKKSANFNILKCRPALRTKKY